MAAGQRRREDRGGRGDGTMQRDSFMPGRRALVEGGVGLALLALAFTAIAASDVSVAGTRVFWSAVVCVFAAAAYASDWMRPGPDGRSARVALRTVLHWVGVLVAIHIVFYFVDSGRMANADTGLTGGLILALGAFLAGVHGNWRFRVLGVALACATVGVALAEEYVWVLLGIALLASLAIALGSWFRRGRARGASDAT